MFFIEGSYNYRIVDELCDYSESLRSELQRLRKELTFFRMR
jgi:hypothetical protein